MRRFLRSWPTWLWLVAGWGAPGAATVRAAGDQVEVAGVQFQSVRPPDGSANNWYEMDVQLDARPDPHQPGRITRPLQVTFALGYTVPATDGPRHWEFYRCTAGLVGLPAGRAHVRFYLPPEIVRRDLLGNAPAYWAVRLEGRSLLPPLSPQQAYAPALLDPKVRADFEAKVGAEGAANDGILQPQCLTPLAAAYPLSTPTMVRRLIPGAP